MCIYPLQSIASALVYEHCPLHLAPHLPPSTLCTTWVYCFPEIPCNLLCRAQDYISARGFGVAIRLGRARIGFTGGFWREGGEGGGVGQTSNHRPVLLLILLNGSERWETLSHIKRQRLHFTHSALRSQLPTAPSTTGINGFVAFSATMFGPEYTLRFAWEPLVRNGEHDFVHNFPWLHWAKD